MPCRVGFLLVRALVGKVPRRGEEDVGEAGDASLAKDGEELVAAHHGARGHDEAVEVRHVGLVAEVEGQRGVGEQETVARGGRVRRRAVAAGGAPVPPPAGAGFGGGCAGAGDVQFKDVCADEVSPAVGDDVFVDVFGEVVWPGGRVQAEGAEVGGGRCALDGLVGVCEVLLHLFVRHANMGFVA